MRYQFRKAIERPEWDPPMVISLLISYDAEPIEVPYGDTESSVGGVSRVEWTVADVSGYGDKAGDRGDAYERLAAESDLQAEIYQCCTEDFALRQQ